MTPDAATIRRRNKHVANKQLAALPTYHKEIPIDDIFNVLKQNGLKPIQEDGTPWEGILCGEDGRAMIHIEGYRFILVIIWYKMESGNYEITAYLT